MLTSGISRRGALIGLGAAFAGGFARRAAATTPVYDIVVYGATPSGIIAAQTGAQHGQRVALVQGFSAFGGMSARGLGHSDIGHASLIGGNALRFFNHIALKYGTSGPVYTFEPHIAKAVFVEILSSSGVDVYYERLQETGGVTKRGAKITAVQLEGGTVLHGSQFVDASYEGDLMAQAGVQYVVGRESASAHGEAFAGFNRFPAVHTIAPRDAQGNLYFGVKPQNTVLPTGAADTSVQAYCYRLCLSNDPANRVPFAKPAGYSVAQQHIFKELLLRALTFTPAALPNNKFDCNSNGIIGGSLAYPDASYAERVQIALEHKVYQQSNLWLMGNDPDVPSHFRDLVNSYGLAADEFTQSGHWPDGALYVREGRRMVGEYVFRQQDAQSSPTKPDSIGVGGWFVDSYACGFYEFDGKLLVEGRVDGTVTHGGADTARFQFPYRSIVPQAAQATNLWVSYCHSATHIGYEPMRIEWISMTLGEAAATAAAIANGDHCSAQAVPYSELAKKLKANGGILSAS